MGKRLLALLLAMTLLFGVTGCGMSKKAKEEKEKAKQEEIDKENAAKANVFVSSVENLPDEITLDDETAVNGARSLYDELTEDQKSLVPPEMLTKLEDAEKTIIDLKAEKEERKKRRAANKEAAKKAEEVINAIPDNVTLASENAVYQARNAYSQLTKAQQKYVSKDAVNKLTSAEAKIQSLKEEEQKKAREAEEAKKKKEEKKAKKASEKKKKQQEKKKETKPADDKYTTAKKYIGKKASALIAAIGSPKSKKKNANCATDGEEYIYYYDGFYVGVLSQDMDSPLIVQSVVKN